MTQLECGLKFPFEFTFTFDKTKCLYPHLKGDLIFPMRMYFAFRGLKFDNYVAIKECEADFVFFTIKFPTFCVGSRRMMNDDFLEYENIVYHISYDNVYEKRIDSVQQSQKKIVTYLMEDKDVITSAESPLVTYGGENQKTRNDRYYDLGFYIPNGKELRLSLYYVDENHELQESDDVFVSKISNLKFDNSNKTSFEIVLRKKKGDDSDLTYITLNIERYPVYFPGNIYHRNSKYVMEYINILKIRNYSLLVIDKDGNRQIDYNCVITPLNLIGSQQPEKGSVFFKYFYNGITITKIIVKKNIIRIIADIMLKYDNDKKDIAISSFVTPLLNEGDNSIINKKSMVYLRDAEKIYHSDGTEEPFTTDCFIPDYE